MSTRSDQVLEPYPELDLDPDKFLQIGIRAGQKVPDPDPHCINLLLKEYSRRYNIFLCRSCRLLKQVCLLVNSQCTLCNYFPSPTKILKNLRLHSVSSFKYLQGKTKLNIVMKKIWANFTMICIWCAINFQLAYKDVSCLIQKVLSWPIYLKEDFLLAVAV